MSIRVILLAVVLGCCGCASQIRQPESAPENKVSGDVTGGVIDAPASDRYKEEQNVHYEQPIPSPDNPLPAYPVVWLSKRLPPVTIQVRVIVNALGNVTNVIPTDTPNASDSAFIQSVQSAVAKWKFNQLVKVVPGPGQTSLIDAFGSRTTYSGKATALPFHQDYRFTFSQSEGKANITVRTESHPGS